MKQIPLWGFYGLGHFAIVDDSDFDSLSQYRWRTNKKHSAVVRSVSDGNHSIVSMHEQILGTVVGMEIDHRDGNCLNNVRSNLRHCTHQQNMANRGKPRDGVTSRYKGVFWARRQKMWRAQIRTNGKKRHLGYFRDQADAARAYDAAAIEQHGEFARTNF